MVGFQFSKFIAKQDLRTPFEQLLELFLELMVHTSGDVEETFRWLEILDREHHITTPNYTLDDFRRDLESKMIVQNQQGKPNLTGKGEKLIRERSLEQIFGKLKRSSSGNHKTKETGKGDEPTSNRRTFRFGDTIHQIDFTESIKNSFKRNGLKDFDLQERDLEVIDNHQQTTMSTVLMIDLSHSMILYGEDRITPAKKVAMALSEWIMTRYPKDTLDIVAFGNDAWVVQIKDLPYLNVGPFHTNTVAGLELAMDILRKRKTANRQIFMITDGKPTCLKERDGSYYKNPGYHDPRIINKTIDCAIQCKKLSIPITTFMVTKDPYLQEFVDEFTEANQGKAFYSGLDGLGAHIFTDYQNNKRRKF